MLSQHHDPDRSTDAARHTTAERELAVLSRANHDMRSPLSVILGVFELLAESPGLDAGERRYLALGSEAAENLLGLADALRLHTSLERGQVNLETAPLDLPALTREAVNAAIIAKGAAVTLRPVTTAESGQALGDADHLREALTALARSLLGQAGDNGESAVQHLSVNLVRHDDQVIVQVLPATASAGPLPADRPADALQPGNASLQLINAARLIDLMAGQVNVDPDGGRLTIRLPAASR